MGSCVLARECARVCVCVGGVPRFSGHFPFLKIISIYKVRKLRGNWLPRDLATPEHMALSRDSDRCLHNHVHCSPKEASQMRGWRKGGNAKVKCGCE